MTTRPDLTSTDLAPVDALIDQIAEARYRARLEGEIERRIQAGELARVGPVAEDFSDLALRVGLRKARR